MRRPQARSLPSRVIHAVPNRPSSENIIGINLSLERLADLAPHRQCAIRTDISLKRGIDSTVIYLELRETLANDRSLCHRQIRALRKALPGTRTRVLDEPPRCILRRRLWSCWWAIRPESRRAGPPKPAPQAVVVPETTRYGKQGDGQNRTEAMAECESQVWSGVALPAVFAYRP